MTKEQMQDTAMILMAEYFMHSRQDMLLFGTKSPTIVWSPKLATGGRCHSDGRIVMSQQAFDEHGLAETLDTWRHELAHLVHMNHSKEFWRLAWALGVKHVNAHSAARPLKGKYTYRCPAGHETFTQRPMRGIRSCGQCARRYDARFPLTLVADSKTDNTTVGQLEAEIARLQRHAQKMTERLVK